MTLKTIAFDSTGKAQKVEGWFSWRHRTRDAHDAASERYQRDHGPKARRRKADRRRDQIVRGEVEVRLFGCNHRSSNPNHPCGNAR